MYPTYNSFQSWKSLQSLQIQEIANLSDDMLKSFVYNTIDYCNYSKAWNYCKEYSSPTEYFYSTDFIEKLFSGVYDDDLLKKIEEDVVMLITASITPMGKELFLPLFMKMESFLICLLGHADSPIRFFATVLLNVLYE